MMRNDRLIPAILVMLPLVVYFSAFRFGFLTWDDTTNLTQNPFFSRERVSVLAFWRAPYVGFYMPLTFTAWGLLAQVSYSLFGELNPALFHGANILLHVFSGLLVFSALKLLIPDRHRRTGLSADVAAGLGTLVFLLHPVQVESVAWASGFRDAFSGFLCFLSLFLYLRFRREQKKPHYYFATAAFLAAMLSKPSAAALPLMVLVLDHFFLSVRWKKSLKLMAPWLLMAAALAIATSMFQRGDLNYSTPWMLRPLIVLDSLGFYVRKLFLPISLCVAYGRRPSLVLNEGWFFWTAWIPIAVFLISARGGTKSPWRACFVLFMAAFLPASGVISFVSQNQSTVFDRYFYVPLFAAALGACLFLLGLKKNAIWVGSSATALLGMLAYFQVQTWENTETLFTHAMAANPSNDNSLYDLAGYYRDTGQTEKFHSYLNAAIEQQRTRAQYFLKKNNLDEAQVRYGAILRLSPADAEALNNLGNILLLKNQPDEAAKVLSNPQALGPRSAPLYDNLGIAFLRRGDIQSAIRSFRTAKKLDPKLPEVEKRLKYSEAMMAKGS